MCGRYGRRADKQRIAEIMQAGGTNVFDVDFAQSYKHLPRRLAYPSTRWKQHQPTGPQDSLLNIAFAPEARAPKPLMAILSIRRDYSLAIWHWEGKHFLWHSRISATDVVVFE